MNQRANAALNPTAIYRDPMTMDDYLTARMITTPFGLYDCDVPCDGAVAVIVSAVDVAQGHAQASRCCSRPSAPRSSSAPTGTRPRMTHEPQVLGQSAHLWTRTSLRPKDVDVAELYDGFSFNCLSWLEALGFCGIGEAKDFLDGGKAIARDGVIPLNTHGGQLSHGRTHGMGLIHEAVTQLRGEAGERQVDGRPRRGGQQRRPHPQRGDAAADRRVSESRRRVPASSSSTACRCRGWSPRRPIRAPSIVAIHGGASTAAYFDCPGHPRLSLLRTGRRTASPWWRWTGPATAARRRTRMRWTRPEQRVALAYGAVDKILGAEPRGAGLFLVGHSAGCELAVRMAVDDQAGRRPASASSWPAPGCNTTTPTADDPEDGDRHAAPGRVARLLWQPARPVSGRGVDRDDELVAPARLRGRDDQNWPRQDFPATRARGCGVPVQFSVAEHERVWRVRSGDAGADRARCSPRRRGSSINEQVGSRAQLSLSVNAAAYHLKVLSFVEECVVAQRERNRTKLEAG